MYDTTLVNVFTLSIQTDLSNNVDADAAPDQVLHCLSSI